MTKFDMVDEMHRNSKPGFDYYKTLVYYLYYDLFSKKEISELYNQYLNA